MYFVMKDYTKSDFDKVGIYVDELSMELGYYDSFRLTCIETNETIIVRTLPDDVSKKTPTIVFHNLDQYDTVHIMAEYMLIGDGDYTFIGTYLFDVLQASNFTIFTLGDDNVAIEHKAGVSELNPKPDSFINLICEAESL